MQALAPKAFGASKGILRLRRTIPCFRRDLF
jgi:hypothetical protein